MSDPTGIHEFPHTLSEFGYTYRVIVTSLNEAIIWVVRQRWSGPRKVFESVRGCHWKRLTILGFVMKRLARAMHHCKSKETDPSSQGLLDRLRCLNTTISARPLSFKYETLRERDFINDTSTRYRIPQNNVMKNNNIYSHRLGVQWISSHSHDLSYTNSLTNQELCPW